MKGEQQSLPSVAGWAHHNVDSASACPPKQYYVVEASLGSTEPVRPRLNSITHEHAAPIASTHWQRTLALRVCAGWVSTGVLFIAKMTTSVITILLVRLRGLAKSLDCDLTSHHCAGPKTHLDR
jgi:hypothetical protein